MVRRDLLLLLSFLFFLSFGTISQAGAPPSETNNAPLLTVSGYEYPINDAINQGKLQHLYVNENHNNKSVKPGGSVSGIAAFPYGEKMLLVATVNTDKLGGDCATGIRWSFMKTGKSSYGGKPGIEVSIIKGAGVPDNQVPTSADQIVTKLGVGPVYPPLPQTVYGLKPNSGEPVDEIKINSNQSWVIIRSFEPGVSKVLVSVVTGGNVVSPEIEYAVNWIGKYPILCQKQKLQVNVVEAADNLDPYIFHTAEDHCINYKIDVIDVSDYYQNPNASCVLPLLYPDICYRLRFRIDPLQQSNPPWPDAYWVGWGKCDTACCDSHYAKRLEAKYNGGYYVQREIDSVNVIVPTKNGAKPGATQSFNAYVAFATYNPDPHFFYFEAKERSVDASVAYSGTSCKFCKRSIPSYYSDINDESTTIEYRPKETIGGLEVTWDPSSSPDGPDYPVHLRNTGGRIYEIFGESPDGARWYITNYLDAGADIWIDAEHGDWIYYHTISNENTDSCREPVIAKQKKVRVQ